MDRGPACGPVPSRPGAQMSPVPEQTTTHRLTILANGYAPLPNRCKTCLLSGWPRVKVTRDEIIKWSDLAHLPDTGIRVDGDLIVIDVDVDDPVIVRILDRIVAEFPQLARALVRAGKGQKLALFCLCSDLVGRRATRPFIDPTTAARHQLEVFGSDRSRQFGAFGAHTRDAAGRIIIHYRWIDDKSPATVHRSELPVLSGADVYKIVGIAEAEFAAAGWAPETVPTRASSFNEYRVYDLTDQMRFVCNDGWTYSLAELTELRGHRGLRCTASFTGERATNETRCLIGWSEKHQCVSIWDSQHYLTHLPLANKPLTAAELAAALQCLKPALSTAPFFGASK